jgi:biopolymer transport protein ExbD
MTSESLRSFLTVPLAAVFLILVLCLFETERPPAMGLRVPVSHVRTFPFAECYDDRSVWVRLAKNGDIRINETPVSRNELKLRISQIYDNREEPNAIFMLVDPEAPYGDFVDVYSKVSSANRSLRVGLMTDGLMALLNACPTGASCGLDWPDHKYIPWCLQFNFPPVTLKRSLGDFK